MGASITRNALDGTPILSCVSLPLVWLWVNAGDCGRPTVTVDALTVVGSVFGLKEGRFDLEASLSSGAPVFKTPRARRPSRLGWALGGSVTYQGSSLVDQGQLHHELVHVLQHDMVQLTFGRAMEDGLRASLGDGWATLRWVDLGTYALAGALLSLTPLDVAALLEREAAILDGGEG